MQKDQPQFDQQDVELIERETCFQGFFQLERLHFRHRRFAGDWSQVVAREVFLRGNATCVLPYDPRSGHVILVEQVRAGALLDEASPWLLELVAGINESHESTEEVARREAREEAGLSLDALWFISEFYPSPGACTEKITLYLARVDASQAGGVHGLEEEQEDIRVHVVPFEEALVWSDSGRINNAPAMLALNWLARHQEQVDARWRSECTLDARGETS